MLEHTVPGHAALVPEIPLRLLRPDSPLWAAFDEGAVDPPPRPYWAFAWSGGQAIARYLLDHPGQVAGRRVLDFASGCGLAAIAALQAGAASVLAADVDPLAGAAACVNAAAAGVHLATTTRDVIGEEVECEVVLAGDIFYDTRLARHGLDWLRRLAARGVLVLNGDPGRHYSPSSGRTSLARYRARSEPDLEHPAMESVEVVRLEPLSGGPLQAVRSSRHGAP